MDDRDGLRYSMGFRYGDFFYPEWIYQYSPGIGCYYGSYSDYQGSLTIERATY